MKRTIDGLFKTKRFSGKFSESLLFPVEGSWLLLVGLGKPKEMTLDKFRQVVGAGARQAAGSGTEGVVLNLPEIPKASAEQVAQAATEGLLLGTYKFEECKGKGADPKEQKRLKTAVLSVENKSDESKARSGLGNGQVIAEAVLWSRDLISRPGNKLTPTLMANEAKAAGKKFGFQVKVLEPPAIKKLGMEALLGVAKGSAEPCRFIIMEYAGSKNKSDKPLVFIGKGITFDSGGISIKPSLKMDEMKYDMGGAGAVLGAMRAVAALKLPVRVVGLIPTSENLPGGSAQKPGDVVKSFGGKTIEVLNTDAEGRLVLADALGYAAKYKPAAIIDLATLTGACVVALGDVAAGLMGNNDKLIEKVKLAGERSAERVWQLPLWQEHSDAIKGEVADVKNIGNGKAGTITAAAFLKEFVDPKTPWTHLDIAGVAWVDATKGYLPKGATGFGVRLLTDLASNWKN